MVAAAVIGVSAVLGVEFLLTAAAGLAVYRAGIQRFAQLTSIALSPVPDRILALLALVGVGGIIAGFWRPGWAVAAAIYFALLTGFTPVCQMQRGQRGQELWPRRCSWSQPWSLACFVVRLGPA